MNEHINESNEQIENIISEFESNNYRERYCAEHLFAKFPIGFEFIDEDEINEKKKKDFENVSKPQGLIDKCMKSKCMKSLDGVSLGKDKNGYFVYTHRARSKSHEKPEGIPIKDIKFIETTG